MRTRVPCNENRFFPVRIDLQGLGLQCNQDRQTVVLPIYVRNKVEDLGFRGFCQSQMIGNDSCKQLL